ncbi:hypothetical protein IAR50_007495 [Cryptococcus sp. DSM 104548]
MSLLKRSIPLGIISLLGLVNTIEAQDNGDTSQYPDWVSNDYDCVIGCLSGFNDTITTIPQPDLESAAYSCSSSTCTGDSTGNYYQTLYYIQLFYATGSIYEWSDSAPDGYKHANFTTSGATSDAAVSGSSDDGDDGADSTDSASDSHASASATDSSDSGAAETGADDAAATTGEASTSTKQSSSASGSAATSAKSGASTSSSTVAPDLSTSGAGTRVGGVQGALAVVALAGVAGGLGVGL